jgi:hypothetical protein
MRRCDTFFVGNCCSYLGPTVGNDGIDDMKPIGKAVILAVVAGSAWAGCAAAAQQDTGMGLDILHEQRREGGRICMSDHFHSGSSSGQPSQKIAVANAIRDWAGFTAWEYGTPWGSWNLAASKTTNCDGGGSNWTCTVEARPCKRGR